MPRYKLRTLLIVLALGPPVLAGMALWFATDSSLGNVLATLSAALIVAALTFGALGYERQIRR